MILPKGHYRDAYHRLKPLIDDPFLQVTPLEYPDFVEAAVRAGHPDEALPLAARLTAMAEANGSAWTRGVAAPLPRPAGDLTRRSSTSRPSRS